MRLSVQRCLILGLCLFVVPAFASYPALPDGSSVYWSKRASKDYWDPPGPSGNDPATNLAAQGEQYIPQCEQDHPDLVCTLQSYNDDPEFLFESNGSSKYRWYGNARIVATPQSCVALSHQPNPITGEVGSTDESDCSCADGWTSSGGSPGENPFDCVIPEQSPEECKENGQVYNPGNGLCELECEHGMFNGTCLLPPEDNSECSSDSPDYRGELVLGYGQSPVPACGDFGQCSGDTPGQVGVVNGELRCIPEDYGVPQCQGDSITVIDEYGFVCEPLENTPEEPDTPEEPNTDTDGDGEPDEYQRENDPTSVDKGLDKINEGVSDTNNKLDGTNKRLDKLGKGIEGVNDNLKEGLGKANNTLDEINEKLDSDEDLDTSGLGDAATFSDTAERLQNAINSHPTIQAVTQIPSVATNNTCPTWTIPGNDYFGPLTIDTHCSIFNDYRGQLSILFILVWTLAAVMIFLRA